VSLVAMKVEFYVYNQYERAIVNEAMTIIENARNAQIAQINTPPEEKLAQALVADMGDAQAEESVVGTITPQGAVKYETPKAATEPTVTEVEMAAVVQKSLDTRGLAETRDLLAPITGGKRWRETDPVLWPAIKAVLA
jgi:hypothetical protein